MDADAAVCSSKRVLNVYRDSQLYFPMNVLSFANAEGKKQTFDVVSFQLMGKIPSEVTLVRTGNSGGFLINGTGFVFLNLSGDVCLSNPAVCQDSGMAISFWLTILPSNLSPSHVFQSRGIGVSIMQEQLMCNITNGSRQWYTHVELDAPINEELLVNINWKSSDVEESSK
ncbi:uncharacterized protein LOC110984416 [Acanthaster planci]|uniref:Uncharacterized protein LOC110984416 n=1 Tax=Acanthaster planci TaxID=133434 RepID=A0A8B7Z3U4_ACAPL|nr:uncharacterized protein LOC110984416 [Acanthaster planci]